MTDITTHDLEAYEAGRRELEEILGLDAEYMQALRGRAQFFLDEGHDERALIMLEMLEELDRRDPMPLLLGVEVLLRLGRSSDARRKIETLLARDPHSLDARVAKAEVELATGSWVQAAATLADVLARDAAGSSPAAKRALALAARAHAAYEACR